MNTLRLVLFTRYPVPGSAKTRLIPALGADAAAAVHKRLTERTVETLKQTGKSVEIRFSGGDTNSFSSWLGNDLSYLPQVDGDLTERLLAAINPAPVIFLGSDTPDLSAHHVNAAIHALQKSDVVIGPADDGGYYLIGIAKPYPFLFENMRWSTEHVMPDTLHRLRQQKIGFELLETLHDCDRPEDLDRWPWLTS
ncbi:TIGR04282 family arsenosugar biosynthesis glycosyltransferase [Parasphingorhabdus litoris]|uniref:TIGR04282 family arsenosugar biosynthesis glycosyltransferase n=1 Tax=Parasphingorhabdus litoris TaxID=394733 RepID=A0ABN1A241_9SPHN|nr:TIGR04282 family arsenosugar biosynthesis glycosyltransferase [Parasphingorhabdus litoris]